MQRHFNKFPYTTIKKKNVDGKRLYDTETGPLPSVTTILEATKPLESIEALQQWRKRVGHDEAAKITTEAANVGTIIHKIIEEHIKENHDYNPGNNIIHRQAKSMASEIIKRLDSELNEVWGTEVSLYYPGLYAGTTDCAGQFKNSPAIIDFKQTNRPKKREWIDDYFLQLCAYGNAHNILYNTDIKTGVIYMCSRAGEFQQFVIEEDEFEYYSKQWAKRLEDYYWAYDQINNLKG